MLEEEGRSSIEVVERLEDQNSETSDVETQEDCHCPSFSTLLFPSFELSFINWHIHLIILIPHLHFQTDTTKVLLATKGSLQRSYSSSGIKLLVNRSLRKDIPLEINVLYSNSARSMA